MNVISPNAARDATLGSANDDDERDSLHILPLAMLPIETSALRRARLIKNARLDSVIELFRSHDGGSGQLAIEHLAAEFKWSRKNGGGGAVVTSSDDDIAAHHGDGHGDAATPAPGTATEAPIADVDGGHRKDANGGDDDDDAVHPDLALLENLSALNSYDVYSLRVSLRKLGMAVDENAHLRLSPETTARLTPYLTAFTRPLIVQIYGDADMRLETFDDVVGLFRDPDVDRALSRLHTMADHLGIGVHEVPAFIEDYGDIFLGLSYYRQCLTELAPTVDHFMAATKEVGTNLTLREDQNVMRTIRQLQDVIMDLMAVADSRITNFERATNNMWQDISPAKFKKLRQGIVDNHIIIGGILCALSVKMDAWWRKFPNGGGSPAKKAEFIMTDLRQGIDRIQSITPPPTNRREAA